MVLYSWVLGSCWLSDIRNSGLKRKCTPSSPGVCSHAVARLFDCSVIPGERRRAPNVPAPCWQLTYEGPESAHVSVGFLVARVTCQTQTSRSSGTRPVENVEERPDHTFVGWVGTCTIAYRNLSEEHGSYARLSSQTSKHWWSFELFLSPWPLPDSSAKRPHWLDRAPILSILTYRFLDGAYPSSTTERKANDASRARTAEYTTRSKVVRPSHPTLVGVLGWRPQITASTPLPKNSSIH